MFSILMKYLSGYICFKAYGGFSERFINLCNVRGILIFDIRLNENSLVANVRKKDYFALRKIAKNSGMKLRVISKHGVPFFISRQKHRIGLLIGLIFFICFMSVMSMFIWSVETVGSQSISDTKILNTVADLGVYKGALKFKINAREASRQAVEKMNGELLWMSINIKGSRAVVEVRDYIEHREDLTYTDPCNIIADFGGLLLSVEVESGKKANYEGNGVKKGDLLISGMLEDRYERTHFYEARGTVTALHDTKVKLTKSLKEKTATYTKVKKVKYIDFFFLEIPLGSFDKEKNFDEFKKEKTLVINKVSMPVGITEKTRAYFNETSIDESNKALLFYDDFLTAYREKYKNSLILSSKLKIKKSNDKITLESNEKCIDFMGEKQIISFAD